jgi:hypothetical protein
MKFLLREQISLLSIRVQREVTGLFEAKQILRNRNSAAKIIRDSFISLRMDHALLNLASSTRLLERRIEGTLSLSAAMYALLQISRYLRSDLFTRLAAVATKNTDTFAPAHGRVQAEKRARHFVCILIQRYVRGYTRRLSLGWRSQRNRRGSCERKLKNNQSGQAMIYPHHLYRPKSPTFTVKVLEYVNEQRLRVEFHPAQHHAAQAIQSVVRSRRQRQIEAIPEFVALKLGLDGIENRDDVIPPSEKFGNDQAAHTGFPCLGIGRVSVLVLEHVSPNRLRVQLCAMTSSRRHYAARAVQSFVRDVWTRQRKEKEALVGRLLKSVLRQAEEKASEHVVSLLAGQESEETTPCLSRLSCRTRLAQSVVISTELSTFLSPIKPTNAARKSQLDVDF